MGLCLHGALGLDRWPDPGLISVTPKFLPRGPKLASARSGSVDAGRAPWGGAGVLGADTRAHPVLLDSPRSCCHQRPGTPPGCPSTVERDRRSATETGGRLGRSRREGWVWAPSSAPCGCRAACHPVTRSLLYVVPHSPGPAGHTHPRSVLPPPHKVSWTGAGWGSTVLSPRRPTVPLSAQPVAVLGARLTVTSCPAPQASEDLGPGRPAGGVGRAVRRSRRGRGPHRRVLPQHQHHHLLLPSALHLRARPRERLVREPGPVSALERAQEAGPVPRGRGCRARPGLGRRRVCPVPCPPGARRARAGSGCHVTSA